MAFRPPLSPGLVQFIDFGMGPEVTTAAAQTIGRWGPDETEEERRKRLKAGLIFQHEELPTKSDFPPDPVAHPPHEPQKTADEAAYVRGASAEQLAAGLRDLDDPLDDPEILELLEYAVILAKAGWRR